MKLNQVLENYSKSNIYPFHMPGHKRMLEGEYQIDMTEVDGVDDLHNPKGVIADEEERLAKIYGSDKSYMLVGGSTIGNLCAIYASTNENDLILIQKNSHKSVYNGSTIRHLNVGYIFTELDGDTIYRAVTLEQIKEAIAVYGKPKTIVITSPTYEGYVCDIEKIGKFCRENEIILIVDSAHGAHFGFNKYFPNPVINHADITIQSLHKTLPSLTQTAVLHLNGNRVRSERIREALDIFETSSPSYVLMKSMSDCMDIVENNEDIFTEYVDNLMRFYKASGELKKIQIRTDEESKRDIGKLIISTKCTNITGVELARTLREKYKIETELASFSYVLAMTSIMDSKLGFERLSQALSEIDEKLSDGKIEIPLLASKSEKKLELWQAKAVDGKYIKLADAVGRVCRDMVCLYPPGSPVVVPGELITSDIINLINKAIKTGIHVTGITNDSICVVN